MTPLYIDPAHENLESAIDQVILNGERIIFHREGRPLAALITVEELEILQELENLEDQHDIKVAEQSQEELGIILWDDIKAKFGC